MAALLMQKSVAALSRFPPATPRQKEARKKKPGDLRTGLVELRDSNRNQ
jgi:hypothetical protein